MPDSLGLDRGLLLERWAAETPDAPALLVPGRTPLTFAGLWRFLLTARPALREHGLRPGAVAALVAPQVPDLITAFLAIAGEGACAPLDPSLTEDEYRFHLSGLGAEALLVQHNSETPAITAARELGMRVLRIRSVIDDPAGWFALEAAESPIKAVNGRQTGASLLLYTSATTSRPKLVPLTSAHLRA
jgi:acyl-CoA synthetase (AMP-forming)/AMP-acid ligase II